MKKKILVIDDDQDILDITYYLLTEAGYEVVVSLTSDILAEASIINPEIILLDEWLDGPTGHEACERLKANEATHNIPVIIFSALNQVEKLAADCHADGFIQKPFDIEYLLEVIETHSKASSN